MMSQRTAPDRRRIALIETDWDGHHAFYCKIFAATLLELGHSLIVFGPQPKDLREWLAGHSPERHDSLQVLEVRPPKPSSFPLQGIRARLTTLAYWRNAAEAISRIPGSPPHLTFFPWLDDYLVGGVSYLVDRLFPHPWSGLYFHPRHLRLPGRSILRKGPVPYSVLRASHCRAVAVLDEGVAGKLGAAISKRVIVLPDVADAAAPDPAFPLLADIRRRARGRKIIGLLGSLEMRKGILTLLETALMTVAEPWFYVFAGAPAAEEEAFREQWAKVHGIVAAEPENCLFYLQRIPTEEQFNAVVDACDLVFAAYLKFTSSSNLLTKAALFRKPIIVSDGYCMGERVQRFRLGAAIPEGELGGCVDALRRLLDVCWAGEVGPDFDGYLAVHSLSQLTEGLRSLVEAATMTSESPTLHST